MTSMTIPDATSRMEHMKGTSSMLTISDLTRVFPPAKKGPQQGVRAVDNVSLEVKHGELFTLLGPSGCGKTTILRSIAGLETPDSGSIVVGDRTLFCSQRRINVEANQRGLGMVYQSYAIWPHMNVYKNVAFPLRVMPRRRRPSKAETRERVERVLTIVQLDHLADRGATDLSGGQQQRLALARALVMEPPVLLLDEPLSNLDAKLREGMRFELMRLQREAGVTSIYVTHDQTEALAMSSRIAIMRGGKVEQVGTPEEVYSDPATHFVADFIGSSNFIPAVVSSVDADGTHRVTADSGELSARAAAPFGVGDEVVVSVRREMLSLSRALPGYDGPWLGRVETRAYLGEAVDHIVKVQGLSLCVRTSPSQSVEPGAEVIITFSPEACTALSKENA